MTEDIKQKIRGILLGTIIGITTGLLICLAFPEKYEWQIILSFILVCQAIGIYMNVFKWDKKSVVVGMGVFIMIAIFVLFMLWMPILFP